MKLRFNVVLVYALGNLLQIHFSNSIVAMIFRLLKLSPKGKMNY